MFRPRWGGFRWALAGGEQDVPQTDWDRMSQPRRGYLRLDAAALGRCAGHVATDQQEIYQEDGKIESGVRDDVMKKAGMACQGRYVRKS